ncbi:MAG: TetR family transcriptional regulator [Verrucomicrobiales bacterium]|nr:TetR family transcriptional regulator [Verrucomicrobiales bacterium]
MSKPGVTKDKLLQVAFDLIWNSSYGSVSVGDICERAGVNKGSFYHFFESKADLAVEAYAEHWKEQRPIWDRLFSSQVPPLERLENWCAYVYEGQKEKALKYGHVCGCPYASVGSEIATQDEKIRCKTEELAQCGRKYVETAIADAIRAGLVTTADPVQAAQRVYYACVGMLVEAKVQNNSEILRDLAPTVMQIIGKKSPSVGE